MDFYRDNTSYYFCNQNMIPWNERENNRIRRVCYRGDNHKKQIK
jgi:hypothetical protein